MYTIYYSIIYISLNNHRQIIDLVAEEGVFDLKQSSLEYIRTQACSIMYTLDKPNSSLIRT